MSRYRAQVATHEMPPMRRKKGNEKDDRRRRRRGGRGGKLSPSLSGSQVSLRWGRIDQVISCFHFERFLFVIRSFLDDRDQYPDYRHKEGMAREFTQPMSVRRKMIFVECNIVKDSALRRRVLILRILRRWPG